jgi:hypothetical protein
VLQINDKFHIIRIRQLITSQDQSAIQQSLIYSPQFKQKLFNKNIKKKKRHLKKRPDNTSIPLFLSLTSYPQQPLRLTNKTS